MKYLRSLCLTIFQAQNLFEDIHARIPSVIFILSSIVVHKFEHVLRTVISYNGSVSSLFIYEQVNEFLRKIFLQLFWDILIFR